MPIAAPVLDPALGRSEPPSAADVLDGWDAPAPPASGKAGRAAVLLTPRLAAGLDWLILAIAAVLCVPFGFGVEAGEIRLREALAVAAAFAAVKVGLWAVGAYAEDDDAPAIRAERSFGGAALGAIFAVAAAALFAPNTVAYAASAGAAASAALAIAGLHGLMALALEIARRRGALTESIVIVGATDAAARLIAESARSHKMVVRGVFDDRATRAPRRVAGAPVLGGVEDLLAWPELGHIDRIVLCLNPGAQTRIAGILERLKAQPNRVDLVLDLGPMGGQGAHRLEPLGGLAAARLVGGASLDARRALLKRMMDVVLAGALFAFLLPALALIALWVRLEDAGPAVVGDRRLGLNGKPFQKLRFRTTSRAPGARGMTTLPGRVLILIGLEHAPQLWNVLKGEMSLVGPAPLGPTSPAAASASAALLAEETRRHRVKPGMTGLAQVNGYTDNDFDKSGAAAQARLRYDLDYVEQGNLWLDLWILARSVPMALLREKPERRTPPVEEVSTPACLDCTGLF